MYIDQNTVESLREMYLQEKYRGLMVVLRLLKVFTTCDAHILNNLFLDSYNNVDNSILYRLDDLVLPGIGYAIYSIKRKCFVASKDLFNKSLVGRTLPVNHIGAKAMETGKEVLAVGRMIMGDLIACAAPIINNNEIVGFVSVGEKVKKVYSDLKGNEKYRIDYIEQKRIRIIEKVFQEVLYDRETLLGTGDRVAKTVKMVYESSKMKDIVKILNRVGPTNASVLLCGETGTGKDVIARYLHYISKRNNGNFVAINCAAVPENLIESELFGYEEGSFTGAAKTKIGKIELANGGTLFLDEIGDMSLNMQAKLLRAIEEKELERVGSLKKEVVDIRIVAATNKDIKKQVAEKSFRTDLYHRLAVVTLFVPPLRERVEDIMPLMRYFMDYYCNNYGYKKASLDTKACDALLKHEYCGNVRELRNIVERMLIFKGGEKVDYEDLAEIIDNNIDSFEEKGLKAIVRNEKERIEESIIKDALKTFKGNRTKTAEFLNISRRNLQNKLKLYGIS